jgi:chaperonin GroEL (HSP60 family)
MKDYGLFFEYINYQGVWEPYTVKAQTVKTAIESACLLLRVDDIVSGTRRGGGQAGSMPTDAGMAENEAAAQEAAGN